MNILLNVASRYEGEDNYEKSISTYKKIIKYYEKNYNSMHPEYVEAYSNLAYTLAYEN